MGMVDNLAKHVIDSPAMADLMKRQANAVLGSPELSKLIDQQGRLYLESPAAQQAVQKQVEAILGSDEFVKTMKKVASSKEVQGSLENSTKNVLASRQMSDLVAKAVRDSFHDMLTMPFHLANQAVRKVVSVPGSILKHLTA